MLEKISGKNNMVTPLQFIFINCHPDFSIFPPKTHLKVELRLDTRIAWKSLQTQSIRHFARHQLIFEHNDVQALSTYLKFLEGKWKNQDGSWWKEIEEE